MIFSDVIVRAFGGKPLHRVAVQADNGLVYVVRPGVESRIESGETHPVGFPETDTFEFKSENFHSLDREWQTEAATRRETWSALLRFRPASTPTAPERKA
jgi:hypothetical protein